MTDGVFQERKPSLPNHTALIPLRELVSSYFAIFLCDENAVFDRKSNFILGTYLQNEMS